MYRGVGTSPPLAWCVAHAWLQRSLAEQRADIRDAERDAIAAHLSDAGTVSPTPPAEVTLLDRLHTELRRELRQPEKRWMRARLREKKAHAADAAALLGLYHNYRANYNGLSFKPSTLKADATIRHVATNLHVQRLDVYERHVADA